MNFSILWQGNPVSVQKTFGTKNYVLYIKERATILKYMYEKPNLLINNNSEIYGSFRHKPRFHRFPLPSTKTDESYNGRKSSHDSPPPELSEKTFLDNTHTNYNVETDVDTSTNNDLNLSCFSYDSQSYPLVEI